MNTLYRFRFAPLILSSAFLLINTLRLLMTFFQFSAESLPYQDPTPEMLAVQAQSLRYLEARLSGFARMTAVSFFFIAASIVLILYFRHYHKGISRETGKVP